MSNVYDSRYTAEVANLEKIASKLDTLLKGHKHIIASKGVNMDMAIALEEIYPGVVSTRTPVASFTGDISLTNYTVTTEAVSDVIKKVRDALVKAWKAVVQKITDWFNATFRNAKKNAQETKANFASMSQKYAGLKTIEDKLIPLFIEFTAKKSAEANDGKGPATPDDLIKAIHSSAFSILSRSVTKNIIALSRGKQWVGTVTAMGGARDIIADLDAKQKALVTAINKGGTIDITQYSVSLTPISKLDTTGNGLALDTGLETVSKLADIISKGSNIYFSSDEKLTLHDPVLAGLFNNTEGTFISVITGIEGILAGDISATLKEVNAGVLKLMSSVGSIDNIANSDALNPILETFRKTLAIVKRIIDTAEMMQRQLSEVSNTTHRALDAWGKQMLEMIANGGFSDDVTKGYKADIMAILKQNASTEDIDNEGPSETDKVMGEGELVFAENARESAEVDAMLQVNHVEPLTGLESVSDHLKNAGKAIAKFIKDMYLRLKAWVSSLFKKTPSSADAKKPAEAAKKQAKESDKVETLMEEAYGIISDWLKEHPEDCPPGLTDTSKKGVKEWRWGYINRAVLFKLTEKLAKMFTDTKILDAFISDVTDLEKTSQLLVDYARSKNITITAFDSLGLPTALSGKSTLPVPRNKDEEFRYQYNNISYDFLIPGGGDYNSVYTAANLSVLNMDVPEQMAKLIDGLRKNIDNCLSAIDYASQGADKSTEAFQEYYLTLSKLANHTMSCNKLYLEAATTISIGLSKKFIEADAHVFKSLYTVLRAIAIQTSAEGIAPNPSLNEKTEDIVDRMSRFDAHRPNVSTESTEVMVDEDGESALDGSNELEGEEESAGELEKIVGLQATMEELGLGSAGHVASDVALHQLRDKALSRNHLKTVSKIDSLLSA